LGKSDTGWPQFAFFKAANPWIGHSLRGGQKTCCVFSFYLQGLASENLVIVFECSKAEKFFESVLRLGKCRTKTSVCGDSDAPKIQSVADDREAFFAADLR